MYLWNVVWSFIEATQSIMDLLYIFEFVSSQVLYETYIYLLNMPLHIYYTDKSMNINVCQNETTNSIFQSKLE